MINLFLLFAIAFLPYPTAISGRYSDSVGATVFRSPSSASASLGGMWWLAFVPAT